MPLMNDAQMNRVCQALFDSLPHSRDGQITPYLMIAMVEDGFQTITNLGTTDQIRSLTFAFAEICKQTDEPTDCGEYTPPSRN